MYKYLNILTLILSICGLLTVFLVDDPRIKIVTGIVFLTQTSMSIAQLFVQRRVLNNQRNRLKEIKRDVLSVLSHKYPHTGDWLSFHEIFNELMLSKKIHEFGEEDELLRKALGALTYEEDVVSVITGKFTLNDGSVHHIPAYSLKNKSDAT
jgi:hypothetical protein